jgi:hypothetical protein
MQGHAGRSALRFISCAPQTFHPHPLDVASSSSDNSQEPQVVSQRNTFAMTRCPSLLRNLIPLACTLLMRLVEAWRFRLLCLLPSPALAAEHLCLRTQLALYQARQITPRRPMQATRMALPWLARWFDWRHALVIVPPATLIRWHRQGFRLCWRWTSRAGRPPIPTDLQVLIRRMAHDNPTWGEERIAHELRLKLGLRVSPRTVRKYLPKRLDHGWHRRVPSQRWRPSTACVGLMRCMRQSPSRRGVPCSRSTTSI